MSELARIRPQEKHRVMDLLAKAGHDVSDWANLDDPSLAATNPKYCYEWSFLQPGCAAVFNLWYDQLEERDGSIVLRDNLRAQMVKYAKQAKRANWRTRARRFDEALQQVWANRLPVRVVINAGKRRVVDDENAKASVVFQRELDKAPWALTTYNLESGDFVLTRGVVVAPPIDHVDMDALAYEVVLTKEGTVRSFVRDAAVRLAALVRANGRCEYCNQLGFPTKGGAPFLETHHIVYLSDQGPDHLDNVAALCPNHHREAHYGAAAGEIRSKLLALRTGKLN